MKKMIVVLLAMLLCSSGVVYASGLAIPEQGAAAMAMSAAVTARSEDLSALFYNPAGIDYVENNEIFLGLIPIMPTHKYDGATSEEANKNTYLPPQLYGARRVHDKVVVGIGVFAPFGLGTDWDKKWEGRYTSTFGEIQTIYVNPTVAYQVNDMLSIGIGVSYVNSQATIEKMIDSGLNVYAQQAAAGDPSANPAMVSNPAFDSEFKLDGDGIGFGFNIGAIVRPIEKLQLGVAYRSATELEYEGKAKFMHSSALAPSLTAIMPASQDGKATLNLPWMLNFGAQYDITEVWDASVDFDFVGWSVYEELEIDFDKNLPMDKQVAEKNWDNSFVFRLGTSYDINETWVARGGFLYDQSPVPDETFDAQLPDNDRTGISLGFGCKIGAINIDAGYMFLKFSDRDKDNYVGYPDLNQDKKYNATDVATLGALGINNYKVSNGEYKSSVNLLAISASYRF